MFNWNNFVESWISVLYELSYTLDYTEYYFKNVF